MLRYEVDGVNMCTLYTPEDFSGIETLTPNTAGEGCVEYYDLQGRRVLNPGHGFYITREGVVKL